MQNFLIGWDRYGFGSINHVLHICGLHFSIANSNDTV